MLKKISDISTGISNMAAEKWTTDEKKLENPMLRGYFVSTAHTLSFILVSNVTEQLKKRLHHSSHLIPSHPILLGFILPHLSGPHFT